MIGSCHLVTERTCPRSDFTRAGAVVILLLASLVWPVWAAAQDPGREERDAAAAKATQLAQQSQNPVSSLISVPFQTN